VDAYFIARRYMDRQIPVRPHDLSDLVRALGVSSERPHNYSKLSEEQKALGALLCGLGSRRT